MLTLYSVKAQQVSEETKKKSTLVKQKQVQLHHRFNF